MSDGRDDEDRIAPEEPAPEPAGPAEVVQPGGGVRPARPTGRLVRTGLLLLMVLGGFALFLGISTAADPERGVCAQARSILEDDADDEDFDADDIPCEEAIVQAEQVPDESVSSESEVRTTGLIVGGIGAVQLITAVVTLRFRDKRTRMAALVSAALGIVFPVLGLITIAVLAFVVYAIFFSADARATFGDTGGTGLFRRRT